MFHWSICNQNGHLISCIQSSSSKVITSYTNHGKTSSARRKNGQKPKLSEMDCHTLKRIVSKRHRTTAAKVTAEFSIQLEDRFHKNSPMRVSQINIHGRAAIVKPLITGNNTKRWKIWCEYHKTWMSDDYKYIIWSHESFMLFPRSGRFYVRPMPKEVYNPECLVPTVKHGGGSVIIWAANIFVFCWSYNFSELPNYCQWLHGHYWKPGASYSSDFVS